MQIQICKRFCFNFAYCDHGNERYTMGVNFLQISCMLICKNEANLVNVIFTMTLLITLRVRKSVFSSRDGCQNIKACFLEDLTSLTFMRHHSRRNECYIIELFLRMVIEKITMNVYTITSVFALRFKSQTSLLDAM